MIRMSEVRSRRSVHRPVRPGRVLTVLLCVCLLLIGLLCVCALLIKAGLLIGNATPSVPRGLYVRSAPDTAPYVTFCLAARHRALPVWSTLCSTEHPDGIRIIKRIALRHADGSLTVAGDTPRALDSRLLGDIDPADVRGWWRPLFLIDRKEPR